MILWIDAQLSRALAPWITTELGVDAYSVKYVGLRDAEDAGTITQANLIARPAIGFGANMAELLAVMRSGNAYVNVHTVQIPAGEIRGQIHERGPTR